MLNQQNGYLNCNNVTHLKFKIRENKTWAQPKQITFNDELSMHVSTVASMPVEWTWIGWNSNTLLFVIRLVAND